MKDAAVVADFLGIVSHRSGLLSLDMTVVLLPALTKMLTSQFDQYVKFWYKSLNVDRYVIAALNGITMLLKLFGPVVSQSMMAAGRSTGVDLALEDR